MEKLTGADVIRELESKYGFEPHEAKRIVEIAREFSLKTELSNDGLLTVRYLRRYNRYTLEPPSRNSSRPSYSIEIRKEKAPVLVSPRRQKRYAESRRLHPNPKPTQEGSMPRKRAAAPVQEVEVEETSDLSAAVDKPITVTAQAFVEWIEDNTGYEADARSVQLAMSLRRKFQHDEASRERVAELREERAATKPEPETAPAKATRRGKAAVAAVPDEPEDETEAEVEEAPAPKPRSRAARGAAKATASTSSTSRPTRGAGRGTRSASKPASAAAPF